MEIKIFDSLLHPTISGKFEFSNRDKSVSFDDVVREIHENNFLGGCAVGMPNEKCYDHREFFKQCSKFDCLIPVAGISTLSLSELQMVYRIGYKFVKIHPRSISSNFSLKKLEKFLKKCPEFNIKVFLCTYNYLRPGVSRNALLTLDNIQNLVCEVQNTKIILVHGGNVELLKCAEIVRNFPNLLLDLSLTFLKYDSSSIDNDIQFLFKSFDQRICIGTDSPDFNLKDTKAKFYNFTKNLDKEKINNISHLNIINFLEI